MKQVNSQALIALNGVDKEYPVGKETLAVLRGVSFEVGKGEFIAIMGPSGSGKSTLLHLLGCLDRPSRGRMVLDGTDVSQLSSDQLSDVRAGKIGFVFQAFNLLPNFTAIENVGLAMAITGKKKEERNTRAKALLERVGLGHRLFHKPSEMSGGEKQRVAIARALANEPSLLLMDEPTGNLDSKSAEDIMHFIEGLWKKQGLTMVLITHEKPVADYAQRVIRVLDGRIESVKVNSVKKRGAVV